MDQNEVAEIDETVAENGPSPAPVADAEETGADAVYRSPSEVRAEVGPILADENATTEARAEALFKLGRAFYYDNQMSEAIGLFTQAESLTDDSLLGVDIALIKGPALSKLGRSAEAVALLDSIPAGLPVRQTGKVHNQRGIILVELGRLPDAFEAFSLAREVYQRGDDHVGEGHALVNMAAAASEIGDQALAESLNEDAWKLTTSTGQHLVAAMIEGNLGYTASRRGDFSAALRWYEQARGSFSNLEDVRLPTAVVETDHAATLLDLGLNNDAVDAADFAQRSAIEGDNQMLAMQAGLLLGEAQFRLGQYPQAADTLAAVRAVAVRLELVPWQLRCDYLMHQMRVAAGTSSIDMDLKGVIALAAGLREAAWFRESLRTIVVAARVAMDNDDMPAAAELLAWGTSIDPDRADPIDVSYAEALQATIDEDHAGMKAGLDRAFEELDSQRRLLGSAELQVRLGHRASDLRSLALRQPLRSGHAAEALVAASLGRLRHVHPEPGSAKNDLREQLRDARVSRLEARLAGRPAEEVDTRIVELEQALLPLSMSDQRDTHFDPEVLCDIDGVVVVSYLDHGDMIWAVRADDDLTVLNLGASAPIASAIRTQRTAMRRMAADADHVGGVDRADTANQRLDELLVGPLQIASEITLVVIPDPAVSGVSWAGLPSCAQRSFSVAPHTFAMRDGSPDPAVGSIGLLGGPHLEHANKELTDIAAIWSDFSPTVAPTATVEDAREVLATCDLVHIAAHGTFRPDNPFLSSLELFDGHLTVLDIEAFNQLPSTVVLACCDSGASGLVGVDLVGTAEALLALGVQSVVAPTIVIDDAAAHRFVLDLYRELAGGSSIAAAVCVARKCALARSTPTDVAAAFAFQVHGGRAATRPLQISRTR